MKKNSRFLMLLTTVLLVLAMTACAMDTQTGTEAKPGIENNGQDHANKDDNKKEEVVDLGPTVQFSQPAGFYDKGFYLELKAENNSPIFYTLDGSDPTTSETAVQYTEKIKIYDNSKTPNVYSNITDISLSGYYPPEFNVDKGIIIRAAFKDTDGNFSRVACNSYFVGKKESYYSDLRVISMVTDADYLFDPDDGAYMIGKGYYEWLNSDEYYFMEPGDVNNPTNYNQDGKESEFPVNIQIFENGQSVLSQDAGVRISGNWTRGESQKSFRLYAREEYGDKKFRYAFIEDMVDYKGELITKFDKVTLSNGGNDHVTHFRDAFIQDLADDLAVDIQDSSVCVLFVNGEFWGHYLIREKAEDNYIEEKYGIDSKEVVVIKNGELDSGSDEDGEDYRNFTQWAAEADMTKAENYQKFCEQMDVQSFIDYMAVETYVNNNDWANGYTNNWMVWRSNLIDQSLPKADGKWRFIFYDLDMSAGLYGSTETAYFYDSLNLINVPYVDYNIPQMLRNLCQNETFKKQFYDSYIRIIDNNFNYDRVEKMLDEYVKKYKEVTKATHARFNNQWKIDSYDGEIDGLKKFFKERPKYAKNQLDIFVGKEVEPLWESVREEDIHYEEMTGDGNNILAGVDAWYWWGGVEVDRDNRNNIFYITQPKYLNADWETQLGIGGRTFELGQAYKLSFDACFDGKGKIGFIINRTDDEVNYPTQVIGNDVIGKDMEHYEYYFTSEMETNNDFNFNFNLGLSEGNYVIQNVVIEKIN